MPVRVTYRQLYTMICGVGLLIAVGVVLVGTLLAQERESKTEDSVQTTGIASRITGGPDAFGYTFADQADGCRFNFIDISSTGTFILDGDDVATQVTLASPFNIYGTLYTNLIVTSNGYISTDPSDTGSDLSNDCPLPSTLSTGGGDRLYPLHDDIDLEPGIGRLLTRYFPTCPRRSQVGSGIEACTVFQWDDAAHFPGGGGAPTFDFQAILYHTSYQIVFQIGPGNPEQGLGSTTGIQNFPPTTGLTYACDTPNSIPDNTAVCFFNPQGGIPEDRPNPTEQPREVIRAPEPLCSDLDGSTSVIVRASLPPGVYATFCSIIAENGVYRRNPGEIGVQSVIDMGVIHAVDVFSPSGESGAGTGLCLQGSGNLIFLPSNQAPRTPQRLDHYQSNGYTCATLSGTGTVVLVRN